MIGSLNLDVLRNRMDAVIDSFKRELSGLRTGRASVNLLDPITVEAYGSKVPLNQVANVSIPEPRMLSVSIWDKSMIGKVDRAIRESSLGLNPIVDGAVLRIPLPELNEQRRKELVKVANGYAEHARISVRHIRRDGMDSLKKMEKESEFSKDHIHILSDKVQKLTDEMVSKIDMITSKKEEEIMQV